MHPGFWVTHWDSFYSLKFWTLKCIKCEVFGGERLNYGRYKEGLAPSKDWAFATCVKGQG